MDIVDLLALSKLENFNMTELFAINQIWREGNDTFIMDHPRRQSALLWFYGVEGEYLTDKGKKVLAPRGALVSLPQGSQYRLSTKNPADSIGTVLIEFCLENRAPFALTEDVELLFSSIEGEPAAALIQKIVAEYAMPDKPWLKMRRDLLELFSLLAAKAEQGTLDRRGFQTIEKGIRYLQSDEKQELSVEEIAQMCFVTPAYFRKLFREYAGMSPAEYRIHRKIQRAKLIMERSEITVAELAEQLGYEDPSYFCRIFKKIEGISPSVYQKSVSIPK